ncbi:Hsp70 family protein [Cognatishimia sp. 1_MG-2023]|uniref:Hsp70 family protein n=1 Tax=Cognatishimia sp. 1_MG-2023 TaxID=3062642 RepID=UPI0026E4739C|nr:Hsp70 family protein [Cognatishimia sp. 1_MG-2023]MDO6727859.1 Hsp70 family protein [Cognatishimia sp. 1_MG-2023]
MPTISPALGIDFGTSNSAVGYLRDEQPHLVEMAPGSTTLPTSFFFDFDTRKTLIGDPANAALLNGDEGRYMRALKRVLGTSLMHEKRQLLNERVTFVDVIARFLKQLKTRAEADAGQPFTKVLSGRPVVFHGADDPREQQAEDDLRLCYEAAGFTDIAFMPEPQAAAIAGGADQSKGFGLIVDIGGGTSDFSIFQKSDKGLEILVNHGVRIGGTDFDKSISFDQVMPLLGKGAKLNREFGTGTTDTPNAIFNDLATWEKIPFLYTAQTRRMVADMAKLAAEPKVLNRLNAVLTDELGHEIAFATEAGKVAANGDHANARINLGYIERDLAAPLTKSAINAILMPYATALFQGAQDTMQKAQLSPAQIDRVVYVGGSSLMSFVTDAMRAMMPQAQHEFSAVFTAVASGLVIAADR